MENGGLGRDRAGAGWCGREGRRARRGPGSEDGDVELPVYEPSPVIPPPAYCAK